MLVWPCTCSSAIHDKIQFFWAFQPIYTCGQSSQSPFIQVIHGVLSLSYWDQRRRAFSLHSFCPHSIKFRAFQPTCATYITPRAFQPTCPKIIHFSPSRPCLQNLSRGDLPPCRPPERVPLLPCSIQIAAGPQNECRLGRPTRCSWAFQPTHSDQGCPTHSASGLEGLS